MDIQEACDVHLLSLVEEQMADERIAFLLNKIKRKESGVYFHSVNVAYRTADICLKLGLGHIDTKNMIQGALLHDVGKLFLDPKVLKKERLNRIDYEEYKKYPLLGYECISQCEMDEAVKDCVLYHRELLSGKGFPNRSTDIPIEAKIVRMADKYESMITDGLGNNAAMRIELSRLANQLGCQYILQVL